MRERGSQLAQDPAVEAFVGGVGVGTRVFDAEQQRGRAAEEFGQRADEADRAAAP